MELKCLCGKPLRVANAKLMDFGMVYKCECGVLMQWNEKATFEVRGEWRSGGIDPEPMIVNVDMFPIISYEGR